MVYEYSYEERILMAITTALSNVSTIPGLFLMKYQGRLFSYYFSIFGIIVSFMYHLCESLDIVIFIPQLKWHELDNIAAIYCLNNLMLSFTKLGLNIEEIEKKKLFINIINFNNTKKRTMGFNQYYITNTYMWNICNLPFYKIWISILL